MAGLGHLTGVLTSFNLVTSITIDIFCVVGVEETSWGSSETPGDTIPAGRFFTSGFDPN